MLLERLWTRGQPRAPGDFEVAARVDAKPPVSFLGSGDGCSSGAPQSESCIMSIPGFLRLSLPSNLELLGGMICVGKLKIQGLISTRVASCFFDSSFV